MLYPFFLDGVATDPKLNQADGMHPTAAGVDIIVTRILPTVEALLPKCRHSAVDPVDATLRNKRALCYQICAGESVMIFCIEECAMPRLFTGLEIPQEIGHSLSSLRGGLPGARWIDPENYHVTLRFIGDIDPYIANEIAHTLFNVRRKPFEVSLKGLSSFGGTPRAVIA